MVVGTNITLDEVLEKSQYHPSINRIRETFNDNEKCSFEEVTTDQSEKKITNSCFPNDVKLAEVIPFFKNDNSLEKENYRPVSVLSHVSKVFERIMYTQIRNFIENKLSALLTGFRKNYSS